MDFWLAIGIAGAVTIGASFSVRKLHERRVKRHEDKLNDRLKAGEDRYFEELRELEAYDPRKRPPWQNVGLEIVNLTIFFGLLVLVLLRVG